MDQHSPLITVSVRQRVQLLGLLGLPPGYYLDTTFGLLRRFGYKFILYEILTLSLVTLSNVPWCAPGACAAA